MNSEEFSERSMANWITIYNYNDQVEYSIHVARLAHEGIPHRIIRDIIPVRRRISRYLLQVLAGDAVKVCEMLGFPTPLFEPESPLSGLGHFLHQGIRRMDVPSFRIPGRVGVILLIVILSLMLLLA